MTSCTDITLCYVKLILLMKISNWNQFFETRLVQSEKLASRKIVQYIFDGMIAHYNFYWISYTSKSFIWIGCSVFCFQQISRSCRSNNIFIMTLLSTTFWSTRQRWWTYTIIKVLVEWIKPFFLPCVYIFVSQNDSMHAWGSGMQCSSTLLNTTNAKSQFTT